MGDPAGPTLRLQVANQQFEKQLMVFTNELLRDLDQLDPKTRERMLELAEKAEVVDRDVGQYDGTQLLSEFTAEYGGWITQHFTIPSTGVSWTGRVRIHGREEIIGLIQQLKDAVAKMRANSRAPKPRNVPYGGGAQQHHAQPNPHNTGPHNINNGFSHGAQVGFNLGGMKGGGGTLGGGGGGGGGGSGAAAGEGAGAGGYGTGYGGGGGLGHDKAAGGGDPHPSGGGSPQPGDGPGSALGQRDGGSPDVITGADGAAPTTGKSGGGGGGGGGGGSGEGNDSTDPSDHGGPPAAPPPPDPPKDPPKKGDTPPATPDPGPEPNKSGGDPNPEDGSGGDSRPTIPYGPRHNNVTIDIPNDPRSPANVRKRDLEQMLLARYSMYGYEAGDDFGAAGYNPRFDPDPETSTAGTSGSGQTSGGPTGGMYSGGADPAAGNAAALTSNGPDPDNEWGAGGYNPHYQPAGYAWTPYSRGAAGGATRAAPAQRVSRVAAIRFK